MEKFRIIQPSAILSPYVRHYWLLESDDIAQAQRVIPSGNVGLLFHRASLMLRNGQAIPRTSLSGQTVTFADLIPTGNVQMIAVVFHPFGTKAFFDMPINELSELIVPGDDLHIQKLHELEDKILNTADDDTCIQMIELFLTDRLTPFKEYNYNRMKTTIHAINLSGGEMSLTRLAETACLGNKQFQRVFNEHIGTTPKEFLRIVRFHKALFTLQNSPSMRFTTLAHACGYYDQAHMTNEFKLFSGYSPREYIAICAPYSDYFSD